VHAKLAPHYSAIGRPSIDPVLMIRRLIIGCVFAIRSERALCREIQVAYRWFCGLGIEDSSRVRAAVKDYLATLDDPAFGAVPAHSPRPTHSLNHVAIAKKPRCYSHT
jgi:hypothetical protein